MLVEKRVPPVLLLTVSTRLQDETTQNNMEIPTVQERVICFGNIPRFKLWSGSTQFAGRDQWSRGSREKQAIRHVFLCTSLHVAQLDPLSVFVTLPDSARLLTTPDDSSASPLSQLKTFAHSISQQIHMSVEKLYMVPELC